MKVYSRRILHQLSPHLPDGICSLVRERTMK